MQKSEIAGLTYKSKNIGDPAYTGAKRTASADEKNTINGILSNFLAAVIAAN